MLRVGQYKTEFTNVDEFLERLVIERHLNNVHAVYLAIESREVVTDEWEFISWEARELAGTLREYWVRAVASTSTGKLRLKYNYGDIRQSADIAGPVATETNRVASRIRNTCESNGIEVRLGGY